jgi:hypothetical protein
MLVVVGCECESYFFRLSVASKLTCRSSEDVDARAKRSSWFKHIAADRQSGNSDPAINKWLTSLAQQSETDGFTAPKIPASPASRRPSDDDVPNWFMKSEIQNPAALEVSHSKWNSMPFFVVMTFSAVGGLVAVSRRITLQMALQRDNAELRRQVETAQRRFAAK